MADKEQGSKIGPRTLPLGVVDRFVVFGVREATQLCPSVNALEYLSDALQHAESRDDLTAVFDMRGLPDLYRDVAELVTQLAPVSRSRCLLVEPDRVDEVRSWDLPVPPTEVLATRGRQVSLEPLDLSLLVPTHHFTDGEGVNLLREVAYQLDLPLSRSVSESKFATVLAPDKVGDVIVHQARVLQDGGAASRISKTIAKCFSDVVAQTYFDWRRSRGIERVDALEDALRVAAIRAVLNDRHEHSLLTQYALLPEKGVIRALPLHANALHGLDLGRSSNELLIGRPAVFAGKTRAVFLPELQALETLLACPETSEHEYQRFFERFPNFLRSLGYAHVYPQIILERADGTSLRPDFVLEPIRGDWCDILDIKRPTETLIVGGRDRKSLGSAVHQVAAQLREYSAAFEEERMRQFLRNKYGLRIYRPRLIALKGRSGPSPDDEQVRRAMTEYERLSILTFDGLLQHAKEHILV